MMSLKKLAFGRRRRSRDGSLDMSSSLNILEARLTEKTDLIDEMRKIVPLDVEAPGLILLGFAGSGKSTILEALTSVPLPRSTPGKAATKMLRLRINSDPTCTRTYALVSLTDPTCRDEKQIRRVNNMEDLPRVLAALQKEKLSSAKSPLVVPPDVPIEEEEEEQESADTDSTTSTPNTIGSITSIPTTNGTTAVSGDNPRSLLRAPFEAIYVRILRPSGPAYDVIELPGIPPISSSYGKEATDAYERNFLDVLDEHPASLILALVEAPDLFDRAKAVQMAKIADPQSRRTLGVVTKMNLVEKDMNIVQKLQMTSRKDCLLPLGYVAIHAGGSSSSSSSSKIKSSFPSDPHGWKAALEAEKQFFNTNALLRGLKPERWGLESLKSMVVSFQSNGIAQQIPETMLKIRNELTALRGGKEAEKEGEGKGLEGLKRGGHDGKDVAMFGANTGTDHFTGLCSETASLASEMKELANGGRTRQERNFNLGVRFLSSMDMREKHATELMPRFCSPESEAWLVKELEEFRGAVNNSDTMMHPIFKKAVREVCFPVLRQYAKNVKDDTAHIMTEVFSLLIDERFINYPRLAEALKRDVLVVQQEKMKVADELIDRLLEAELNWVFIREKDMHLLQKEVETGLGVSTHPQQKMHEWSLIAEGGAESKTSGSSNSSSNINALFTSPEGTAAAASSSSSLARPTVPAASSVLRPAGLSQEVRAMQLSLDGYVRLLLCRNFYAIPMNVRNIIVNEFRQGFVATVAEKYNDEQRLRMLMLEEMWVNQKRQQDAQRQVDLEGILLKMDQLS